MEWSHKSNNNYYSNFLSVMEDSTMFTNWNTACKTNDKLKESVGITDNFNYRQWLIKNGREFTKKNKMNAYTKANVTNDFSNLFKKSDKYIFKSNNDNRTPEGYETSNLKEIYLSKQKLNEKLVAPIMTQYDLMKNGLSNYF